VRGCDAQPPRPGREAASKDASEAVNWTILRDGKLRFPPQDEGLGLAPSRASTSRVARGLAGFLLQGQEQKSHPCKLRLRMIWGRLPARTNIEHHRSDGKTLFVDFWAERRADRLPASHALSCRPLPPRSPPPSLRRCRHRRPARPRASVQSPLRRWRQAA
jgi:hypothetical protein